MHIYYCSFYSSRQNVSACANHTANAECCKQEGLEINAASASSYSNSCRAGSFIFADGAEERSESNESGLTQLIVQQRRGRLLHFAGHRPGDATLAAPLAVGGASALKSHGGFFVLRIFSRSVIPVLKYHNQLIVPMES